MPSDASTGRNTIDFQRSPAPSPPDEEPGAFRIRPLLWAVAYVLVTTASFSRP